jgi:hypothetical protein
MTTCYLIQSHTAPAQVLRLATTIRRSSPDSHVLIVHDARSCPLDPAPFERIPGVEVLVRRERVARGELSVLSPLFAGLEHLLGSRRPFDWLVYLSGQDYPTRPLAEFEAALAATPHDGFLTWWDVTDPGSPGPWRPRQARTRFFGQYRRLPDWTLRPLRAVRFLGKVTPLRFHLHYGPFVGWQPRVTPFDRGMRCYAGWQWWTLSRPAVEYLWSALTENGELVRWLRRVMLPCESLVQSVLLNSGRFDLHPDNRRFVDFAGSRDGRPRTLGVADLPAITSGAYDFARKFDPERDSEVLDRLDAEALGL